MWLGMQSEPSMGVKDMAWLSAAVACLVAAALPQLELLMGQFHLLKTDLCFCFRCRPLRKDYPRSFAGDEIL